MQQDAQIKDLYAISDLSKEFGVSTRAIRFYEAKGLLAPERVGTTRVFRHRDRARLNLILRGKRLGFSLKDIEEYLSLYEAGDGQTAQIERLLAMVDKRMELLSGQMADLKTTISELSEIRKLAQDQIGHKAS